MTKQQVTQLQRQLNYFTHKYLRGIAPIRVDGKLGPATKLEIRHCQWYLGYQRRNEEPSEQFIHRLTHPKSKRYAPWSQILRGMERRRRQRHAWERQQAAERRRRHGLVRYNGVTIARWMLRYCVWAKAHGWQGWVRSGWRDPNYSERLCYAMCGHPSCPGRCAGRASNHSGQDEPAGALDVTDYVRFRSIIARCPYEPKLTNHLPADPVHFSASGY